MNQNKRKLVFILAMLVASSMTLAGCSNVNSNVQRELSYEAILLVT